LGFYSGIALGSNRVENLFIIAVLDYFGLIACTINTQCIDGAAFGKGLLTLFNKF